MSLVFEKAAFYGGMALRIVYGLNRFSEDLEFSFWKKILNFPLSRFLKVSRIHEFEAPGMKGSIRERLKTAKTHFNSVFLKSETVWKDLILDGSLPQSAVHASPPIRIKLEIDGEPPYGYETEE